MSSFNRQALILGITEFIPPVLGFAATLYLTRVLSPEGYGLYAIAFSFLAIGLLITDGGTVTNAMVKTSASSSAGADFGNLAGLRITQTALTALPLAIVLLLCAGGQTAPVLLILLPILLIDAFSMEWFCRARGMFGFLTVSKIIQPGIFLVLLIALVHSPEDLLFVPLAFLISFGCTKGLMLLLLRPPMAGFRPVAVSAWRRAIIPSLAIGAGGFLAISSINAIPILLGYLAGAATAGEFAAAFKIIVVFMAADRIMHSLYFSRIPKLIADNSPAVAPLLGIAASAIVVFSVPIALAVGIAAEPLCSLILGRQWGGAAPMLAVGIWFLPLTMINSLHAWGLLSALENRRFLVASVFGAVCGLGATIALITLNVHYAAPGALLVSELAFVMSNRIAFNRICRIPLLRPLAMAVAVSLIVTALHATVLKNAPLLMQLLPTVLSIPLLALGASTAAQRTIVGRMIWHRDV